MSVKFFISSSSEQRSVGTALESTLSDEEFEPTLWCREAHGASQYNLEALLAHAAATDFAVFVFAPDDQVSMRGESFGVVRDNVLFELGLFVGALGRDRCFIVREAEVPMHMPSDLEGVTDLHYSRRSDGNLRRSLGPPTTAIAERVRHVASSMVSDFSNNDLKLLRCCKDTSSPSNQAFKAFGSKPSAWDDKLCMRFVRLLERDLIKSTGPTEVEATRKGRMLSAATLRA